jgi:hypothetical protein
LGDLKRKLKGEEFDTMEGLPARVEELLGQLTLETMQEAEEHWVNRLQRVMRADGDCV